MTDFSEHELTTDVVEAENSRKGRLSRIRGRKYYVEILALIVAVVSIAATLGVSKQVSGRWAWEPATTVVNEGFEIVMIDDLESRTMTYEESIKRSESALAGLDAQVAEFEDAGTKLAVFWGQFCIWWTESAGFVTSDYEYQDKRPYPPYEIYWKGAEKLYGELYHLFRDEYGTDKPLPVFIDAQQAACLVI